MKFIEVTRYKNGEKIILKVDTICNIRAEHDSEYITSAEVWTDYIPCRIETDDDFVHIREKYAEIKDRLKEDMI